MQESTDDTRLGALLLEGNLVREEDLERCLEIQALTGGSRPLGQILVEQDAITAEDLSDLLRLQRQRISERLDPMGTNDRGVGRFLAAAAAAGASELILSEGRPVMVRLGGQLRALDEDILESPEMWQFLLNYMGDDVLDRLADVRYLTQDFECEGIGRGRMTAFRHFDGACAVVRLHPESPRSPDEAGLNQQPQVALSLLQ